MENKMEKLINKELDEAGFIDRTSIYSTLTEIVKEAIDTINIFGYEYWDKETVVGPKIKTIVKKLAKLN